MTNSVCDKYTTALLGDNNSTNQYTLMVLLVNTAFVGNFVPTPVGSNAVVQGILSPTGVYNGLTVDLTPYFDGGLYSTNRNGVANHVNFIDGGGQSALTNAMPSDGTSSNQYFLFTHLYSFFGVFLGCSQIGNPGFPAYAGGTSMYDVHKFMDLNSNQVNYFIQEVGAAALSFGFTQEDTTSMGTVLSNVFGYRCTPAVNLTSTDPELQSICIDPSCPIAARSPDCSPYDAVLVPLVADLNLADGQGVSTAVTLIASGATTSNGIRTSSATFRTSSATSRSSSATSRTSSSGTPLPSSASSSSGLSAGAKAGIGVGVAVLALAAIALAVFVILRRRRRLASTADAKDQKSDPDVELPANTTPAEKKVARGQLSELSAEKPPAELEATSWQKNRAELSSGEKLPVEIGSSEKSPVELGSSEKSPVELGSNEKSPVEIGSSEKTPLEIGSSEKPSV